MEFMFYVVAAVVLLVGVQGQQCPHNNIQFFFGNDPSFATPLVNTLCLRCGFVGNDPFPSDTVWSLNGNTLTNGSMNGEVLIDPVDPNQNTLIILNPDNILSVGDILRCSSASVVNGLHTITIAEFIFRNPVLSPDGGSDMIIDVIEGTDLTLSCKDPGNTGTTSYQWFDSTGSSLTGLSGGPTLNLTFINIQRNSSELYICQSTKTNVPGVIKMSNVTINVQYPAVINSISPASAVLPRGNIVTINCTFKGNPAAENITWEQNRTVLNPNNFTHISVNTQSTYTVLTLILQGLKDSGSYVCVTENIIGIERSSKVNITVQVAPSPVTSLDAQLSGTSSVKLMWSYGFNGNADIIGVNITYEAVSNNENFHSGDEMVSGMLETTISDLQPFTIYNFTVIVINTVTNIVGTSIPVSVTIETAPLVPNAPTLNSVTAINSTALRVSWTDNRDPFTQTPVQSITVTYVLVDQSQSMLSVIVLSPSTTVDIGDLMKGTYYNVTIYANNSVGRSPDSNSVTTRTDIDRQTRWEFVSLFPPILGEKFQVGCFSPETENYEWFINGNEPSGVSITTAFGGSLLTINSFTKQFIGEYKCRAILNGTQEEIYLNVPSQNYTLDITGNTQIIEGNPLQLKCIFMSEDRSVKQYKWKVTDTNTSQEITLSGQNSSTLHITSPSKQYTLYTCEVIVEPTDLVLSVSTSVSIFNTTIKPSTTPIVIPPGSCLALNFGYPGCCDWSMSPVCTHKQCYCDEHCHKWNDCCNDIANINCYPIPTSTDILSATIKPSSTPTVTPSGSCLALNLSYSGCCKLSLSSECSHKGCYCDEHCYKWNDCCSDIANIGCHDTPT